ncbi:L-aspartate oxidase [Flavobacterium limnosediminis JC2902]|uniref:L-aspartate oxidase n=1 Tax=Flavobacterium limnosediminis JC2902 TaxID=1341181 RepID=V6SXV6_9FLAO|nr:L-aspartate oxidase [Flavobacterium limnosediminis]ESU29225.1 L-aspartate oxidase [Flavobacterium limnosediminis JC2902]
MRADYLIIGSGVAGLTFALKIANHFPERRVVVITKSEEAESNTKYAQGGVAVVIDEIEDSFDKHIRDTLIAGDGICDKEIVEMVVTEGPRRFKELVSWGAKFDKNTDGGFDLGKEGGHSENRVVHHKDQTGFEIERAILKQVNRTRNITLLEYHFVLDLIIENNRCYGVYVLNEKDGTIEVCKAGYTVLATGGIGQVYGHTTNPEIATGDGIAMVHRAKGKIKDMEFIQFHPTALYDELSAETFLISEAVRGFGAFLRNKTGHRFMFDYDIRGELASRDIVSQSIYKELKESQEKCVYLDCTHLDPDGFNRHFPMIFSHCKSLGIDVAKDWIPVIPAQHYLCGGIVADKNGKTSIGHLFACGECSRTGLHGANRLASNSLLEALVFSDRIFRYISGTSLISLTVGHDFSEWNPIQKGEIDPAYVKETEEELQLLMRENAGIVRNDADLVSAKKRLLLLQKEVEGKYNQYKITTSLCELRNMIQVALLIVEQSLQRSKNCGGFLKINQCVVS